MANKWQPAKGYTVLDVIGPDKWRDFRFAVTRNGHYVGFFMSETSANELVAKRRLSHTADTWNVIARNAQ